MFSRREIHKRTSGIFGANIAGTFFASIRVDALFLLRRDQHFLVSLMQMSTWQKRKHETFVPNNMEISVALLGKCKWTIFPLSSTQNSKMLKRPSRPWVLLDRNSPSDPSSDNTGWFPACAVLFLSFARKIQQTRWTQQQSLRVSKRLAARIGKHTVKY